MDLRRLIRHFVLFSLGFLVLSAGLQAWYQTQVVNDTRETQLTTGLQKHKTDLDYLFLGDSHAMKGVDTSLIPDSFLYAFTGESFTLNLIRLRRLLDQGVRPRTLVLSLDLHAFGHYRRDFIADDTYWVRQPAYLDLGKQKGRYFSYLFRHLRARTLGYVGSYRRMAYAVYPSLPRYLEAGPGKWMLLDSTGMAFQEDDLAADGLKTAETHFGDGFPYPDPELERDFQQMLKLCQAQGVPVALVRYPVTPGYYQRAAELIGPDATRPLDHFVFGGDTLPVFDATQRYVDHLEYFLDAHHLNPRGRTVFSRDLADWLQRQNF